VTNQEAGCNMTKITMTGETNFYQAMQNYKTSDGWTDDDIATVMNYSDGYKMQTTITLASDGFWNKSSGTCFQIAWVTST